VECWALKGGRLIDRLKVIVIAIFFVIMGQTQDWVFTLGTVLFGTGIGITIDPALFGDVNIAAIILLVPSTKI
jgi:hypothetical protein